MPAKGKKTKTSKKPTSSIEIAASKKIPIEWVVPPDIRSSYDTHMLVQRLDHEVFISFFEVQKPVIMGTPEEKASKLKKVKAVEAKCVSRVIISLPEMPKFIEALISVMQPELSAAVQEQLSLEVK